MFGPVFKSGIRKSMNIEKSVVMFYIYKYTFIKKTFEAQSICIIGYYQNSMTRSQNIDMIYFNINNNKYLSFLLLICR